MDLAVNGSSPLYRQPLTNFGCLLVTINNPLAILIPTSLPSILAKLHEAIPVDSRIGLEITNWLAT